MGGDMSFFVIAICVYFGWCLIWGFICDAIVKSKGYDSGGFLWGFLLGIIGLIVCALKPNIRNQHYMEEQNELLRKLSDSNNSASAKPAVNQWQCSKCNRINANYVTTCICGMSKDDNNKPKEEKVEPVKTVQKKETDNISLLREYKQLLDEGVITEEDFNKKKEELLK